jgi:hypothetical protein
VSAPYPEGFTAPKLTRYDGKSDPSHFVRNFVRAMKAYRPDEMLYCNVLPTYFDGPALAWFNQLPPRSVWGWEQFVEMLVSRFYSSTYYQKSPDSIMNLRQHRDESLMSFYNRFVAEQVNLGIVGNELIITALKLGITDPHLAFEFIRDTPVTSEAALAKLRTAAEAQEILINRGTITGKKTYSGSQAPPDLGQGSSSGGRDRAEDTNKNNNNKKRKDRNFSSSDDRHSKPEASTKQVFSTSKYPEYTALATSRREILQILETREQVMRPPPCKAPVNKVNESKYCEFHRCFGHYTDSCRQLRDWIEDKVRRGELREFLPRNPEELTSACSTK